MSTGNCNGLERSLAALRPDGEAISGGLASPQQDESRLLLGHALQAQAWTAGKRFNHSPLVVQIAPSSCGI